jgi:hypothetical protein
MSALSALFGADAMKTAVVSVVMATCGWAGHTVLEMNAQSKVLDEHTVQIQKLFDGQAETHKSLQDVTTTLTRMEGKIDVVNQKVDDDRSRKDRK